MTPAIKNGCIALIIGIALSGISACNSKKPALAPTQIVDGKSIIIPPEFDSVPYPRPAVDLQEGTQTDKK